MPVPGNQVRGFDVHDHVWQVVEQRAHDKRLGVRLQRPRRPDARNDEERPTDLHPWRNQPERPGRPGCRPDGQDRIPATREPLSLTTGTRLGPYEILSPLGAGGMGEVYRAKDTKLGREVAIKVLPESVSADPERLARFEREARALASLNHPNIVTVYSVEEAGAMRLLAMELVEGQTLDLAISAGGLSLSRFFEIAVPLADALSAA